MQILRGMYFASSTNSVNFIFEDHWPDFVNNFVSKVNFKNCIFVACMLSIKRKILSPLIFLTGTVRCSPSCPSLHNLTTYAFLVIIRCFIHCTDEDDFESLNIMPYSTPPDLPDVMKPTDRATTA